MNKILERIFWDGENYINKTGKIVKPEPISEPCEITVGFGDEKSEHERVEYWINNCIPKTSKEYIEANSYCRQEYGPKIPIQFHKI